MNCCFNRTVASSKSTLFIKYHHHKPILEKTFNHEFLHLCLPQDPLHICDLISICIFIIDTVFVNSVSSRAIF